MFCMLIIIFKIRQFINIFYSRFDKIALMMFILLAFYILNKINKTDLSAQSRVLFVEHSNHPPPLFFPSVKEWVVFFVLMLILG